MVSSTSTCIPKRRVDDHGVGRLLKPFVVHRDRKHPGFCINMQITPHAVAIRVHGLRSVNMKRLAGFVLFPADNVILLGLVVDSV